MHRRLFGWTPKYLTDANILVRSSLSMPMRGRIRGGEFHGQFLACPVLARLASAPSKQPLILSWWLPLLDSSHTQWWNRPILQSWERVKCGHLIGICPNELLAKLTFSAMKQRWYVAGAWARWALSPPLVILYIQFTHRLLNASTKADTYGIKATMTQFFRKVGRSMAI